MLAEALATAGGSALVTAMVTDGWESVKAGFARLLGRGDESRSAVAAERLERSRGVLAGLSGAELERARAAQQAAWAARLADLLEERPDAAGELEALVGQAGGGSAAGRVQQVVTGSGQAQQAVQGQGVQVNRFGGQGDDQR